MSLSTGISLTQQNSSKFLNLVCIQGKGLSVKESNKNSRKENYHLGETVCLSDILLHRHF